MFLAEKHKVLLLLGGGSLPPMSINSSNPTDTGEYLWGLLYILNRRH